MFEVVGGWESATEVVWRVLDGHTTHKHTCSCLVAVLWLTGGKFLEFYGVFWSFTGFFTVEDLPNFFIGPLFCSGTSGESS